MGYFLLGLFESAVLYANRKFTNRWGWRGFALSLGLMLALWALLLVTR